MDVPGSIHRTHPADTENLFDAIAAVERLPDQGVLSPISHGWNSKISYLDAAKGAAR
jgi:hypothetical protein